MLATSLFLLVCVTVIKTLKLSGFSSIDGAPGAFNIEAVGAVLGESYQVISTTETKVGEEHYSIEVGGTTYFVYK